MWENRNLGAKVQHQTFMKMQNTKYKTQKTKDSTTEMVNGKFLTSEISVKENERKVFNNCVN